MASLHYGGETIAYRVQHLPRPARKLTIKVQPDGQGQRGDRPDGERGSGQRIGAVTKRRQRGLHRWVMAEVPSVVYRIPEYAAMGIDGVSIGSNDLTQLTLGLDRDSGLVAERFDERDDAVKLLLSMAIRACRKQGKYVGICGQGPSDHPDLARWLMEQGIESMSLNPDTVVSTWIALAENPPPQLAEVILNFTQFADGAAKAAAMLICRCKTLRALSLKGCCLTSIGAAAIAAVLTDATREVSHG